MHLYISKSFQKRLKTPEHFGLQILEVTKNHIYMLFISYLYFQKHVKIYV